MTPPHYVKPVAFAVSAGVLLTLVLMLSPGARGLFRGGADGGKEAGEVAAESGKAVKVGERGEASARVRERPPELTKTQRQVRNLLSEMVGVMGPPPNRINRERLDEFRAELDRMSPEDLLAVLAELDASGLSTQDKRYLAGFIPGSLSRRDPRLAMDTFVPRLSGGGPGALFQLGIIYNSWAATDLGAAAAWFDEQMAKGTLGEVNFGGASKGDSRAAFESGLIRAQAAMDPAAADARFAAMSAETREKILSDEWFKGASAEKIKAEAEFLRTHYEDGVGTLAKAGKMRIQQGDLGSAEAFLNLLEPSADERAALVGEALRVRVTGREELTLTPEEAREWIVKQSPEDAGHLTGTMLGQMMEWHEFADMSRLALQYREESGSDEVLVAFLKSAPVKAQAEILALAEKIEDPAVRGEVMGRFGR